MIVYFVITRAKLRLVLFAIFIHSLMALFFHPVVSASQSVPRCHEEERSALLELKRSFGGNNTCLDSWGPAEDEESGNCSPCAWYGIYCDEHTGHVTTLELRSCQLTGQISSSIGSLPQLSSLYLIGNMLTGPIPSSIGNLSQLSYLDFRFNHLTGPIPSSFGKLTQLEILSLGDNQLDSQIPSSLGNLTPVFILDLKYNQLTGLIPLSIANLTKLIFLDLSSNRLVGQIPSLNSGLFNLNLSHNQFTGLVPESLIKLNSIGYLDLRSNKLQGPLPVPSQSVKFYFVSNNGLSGEISPLVCNSSSIEVLDLSNNNLVGHVPQCLSNLSKTLKSLRLQNNNLSGAVPKLYKDGCPLIMVDFSNNQLEGPLPHSFVNCKGLEYLNFGNNLVEDKFPSWLGALSNLTVLILRSNRFHGHIGKPHKISDHGFPKLQIIDLSHNNFQGSLPSNYFEHWIAMRVSNLNESGYLGYGSLVDYAYSMEIVNKGTEMVYERIFNHFTVINLSGNNFSGGIPSSLGSLQGLHLLNLSDNILTGHIPPVLCNLNQLESLDLSRNMLSGNIPYQLTDLHYLEAFNVSYNQLRGSIPRGRQFNTFPNNSYMGNEGLCGDPLSKKCGGNKEPPPPPPPPPQNYRDDSDTLFEFDWRTILPGFACGIVIGAVLGQGVPIGRDSWFVRKFGWRDRRRRH